MGSGVRGRVFMVVQWLMPRSGVLAVLFALPALINVFCKPPERHHEKVGQTTPDTTPKTYQNIPDAKIGVGAGSGGGGRAEG